MNKARPQLHVQYEHPCYSGGDTKDNHVMSKMHGTVQKLHIQGRKCLIHYISIITIVVCNIGFHFNVEYSVLAPTS